MLAIVFSLRLWQVPTILTFPLEFLDQGFQGRGWHEFLVAVLVSHPRGKYININYKNRDITVLTIKMGMLHMLTGQL